MVDEYLKNLGHEVLRLPPYYCIFNPIEMVWSQVKRALWKGNVNPKESDSIDLIRETINRVTPHNWDNYCKSVKKEEDKFRVLTEKEDTDRFIISISTGDSSDEDDEEDWM